MKLLFDFLPILLFFIAYKLYGIYIATGVAMGASLIQVSAYWLRYRRFETMHLITLVMVLLLGSATLLLHNTMFIKWKPTAIYWVFAIAFAISQFFGQKSLIQHLMGGQVSLPRLIWQRLNLGWIIFFIVMGVLNLYVVYHFSTNFWVNFKLFGTLGLTVLFILIQAVYMARYVNKSSNSKNSYKNEK